MTEQVNMFSTEESPIDGKLEIKINMEAAIKPEQFKGEDYDQKKDFVRLRGIMLDVYNVVSDGGWWSVPKLEEEIKRRIPGKKFLQDSVRRCIGYMNHEKYGSLNVVKKKEQNTTYYRLIKD